MRTIHRNTLFTMSFGFLLVLSACNMSGGGQDKTVTIQEPILSKQDPKQQSPKDSTNQTRNQEYLVTFIELGSVRCIPCQQMQPVMKSVEEKYGEQVKVFFTMYGLQKEVLLQINMPLKLFPPRSFWTKMVKNFSGTRDFSLKKNW